MLPMKQSILKFYISIICVIVSIPTIAQEEINDSIPTNQVVNDSLVLKDKYGLRVGIDLFKPVYSLIDEDVQGFEIVGDYRITKSLYIAAEIGYMDRYTEEDYLTFTTEGSYIKAGVNYNLYKNWAGMSNEIYVGIRYGFSPFSQTLHSYSPHFYGEYFDEIWFETETEYTGLTAHWAEFVMGIKVEIFNNFYMGGSLGFKKMITHTQPDNFLNMYVPGFERVYLNETGFSFNYTISYTIPFYKKDKKIENTTED